MLISQFRDAQYFQDEIIAKGRTGYSVEGFLGLELTRELKEKLINKTQLKMEKKEIYDSLS